MSHWTRSSAYRLSNERSASSTVDPIPTIPSVTLDPRNAIHNWLRNDNCGPRVAVGLLGCAAQYFIIFSLACSGVLISARIGAGRQQSLREILVEKSGIVLDRPVTRRKLLSAVQMLNATTPIVVPTGAKIFKNLGGHIRKRSNKDQTHETLTEHREVPPEWIRA